MHAATSVTRTKPCHAAVRLTLTAMIETLISGSVTVRASNTFNLSHLCSLRFFPRRRYKAKVA